jgi:hypothetical protein
MALTWRKFNKDNIVFEEVKSCVSGDLVFKRIFIKYRYPDGKTDKLSISMPELFSWGIQANHPKQTGSTTFSASSDSDKPVQSYTISMVMHEQTSEPTEDQLKTIKMFEIILDVVQQHLRLMTTKKALKKFDMDPDTDRMKIFYYKKDEGVIVQGVPPTLYAKLLTMYEENRNPETPPTIYTQFYASDGETPIDPKTLIGCRCKIAAALIIDHIYVGDKPSIQIKVHDVDVIEQFNTHKRLLIRERPAIAAAPVDKTPALTMFKTDEEEHQEMEDETVAAAKIVNRIRRKV